MEDDAEMEQHGAARLSYTLDTARGILRQRWRGNVESDDVVALLSTGASVALPRRRKRREKRASVAPRAQTRVQDRDDALVAHRLPRGVGLLSCSLRWVASPGGVR